MARQAPRRRQAFFVRRHAALGFKRILRRYQPPQLIQSELFDGLETDMQMARMRRVEGAAEQADPAASSGHRKFGERRKFGARRMFGGRRAGAGGRAPKGFQGLQGRT